MARRRRARGTLRRGPVVSPSVVAVTREPPPAAVGHTGASVSASAVCHPTRYAVSCSVRLGRCRCHLCGTACHAITSYPGCAKAMVYALDPSENPATRGGRQLGRINSALVLKSTGKALGIVARVPAFVIATSAHSPTLVSYIPGIWNVTSDALSRFPCLTPSTWYHHA